MAASLTIAEFLLPGWLLTVRRRHPDLEISASGDQQRRGVRLRAGGPGGRRVRGIARASPGPHPAKIGDDRLALVVAARYPLAARAATGLAARDLVDQPLLLREVGSGTRTTFLDALRHTLGTSPALPHATDLGSTSTILATVRAGGGVGVVSARATAVPVQSGELVELRVDDLDLHRDLNAVWQGRHPTPLAGELLDIAQRTTGSREQ